MQRPGKRNKKITRKRMIFTMQRLKIIVSAIRRATWPIPPDSQNNTSASIFP